MGLLVSGKNPAALKTAERTYFTATAGQTTFTLPSGYAVGDIDVFMNGIRLIESDDYFASNGSTVILTSAAAAGDSVVVICYYQFQAAGSYTKAEADARYLTASAVTPLTGFLRAPNYGVSSTADNLATELTAAPVGSQGVGVKAWGRSMSVYGGDVHMIADSRGAGGGHKFFSWNGTANTQLANIDSSGRLFLPYQPAFRGYLPTAADGAAYVTFGATDSNFTGRNAGFNASTGIFTAPVAGVYVFTYCLMHGNGGSTGYARTLWKINGSSNTQYGDTLQDFSGSYRSTSQSMAFRLAVGDTVGIYNEGRKVYDTAYGSFSGYFLG